jgi:hypothetical protein
MTKVTILGEKPKTHAHSGIRFMKRLDTGDKMIPHSDSTTLKRIYSGITGSQPYHYEHIELICRDYYCTAPYGHPSMDLMFAYDQKRSTGVLYMGYFNDGVVIPMPDWTTRE